MASTREQAVLALPVRLALMLGGDVAAFGVTTFRGGVGSSFSGMLVQKRLPIVALARSN
jgi:hypothetical protein